MAALREPSAAGASRAEARGDFGERVAAGVLDERRASKWRFRGGESGSGGVLYR